MNSSINSVMGARDWGMLLTLSVLWGGSFFLVEVVVSDLPPRRDKCDTFTAQHGQGHGEQRGCAASQGTGDPGEDHRKDRQHLRLRWSFAPPIFSTAVA